MEWSYLVLTRENDPSSPPWELEEWLDDKGKAGWELIVYSDNTFIFKRPAAYPKR